MRTIFTLTICCFISWFCHSTAEEKSIKPVIASMTSDTVSFKNDIQPILQKNCSPCHFPGGKLYEKLPFDRPSTILNHEPGIFKRIKKAEEVELFKKFIEESRKEN
jgi:hypothetical protein